MDNYCTRCTYREEKRTETKTKEDRVVTDFLKTPARKIVTNKGRFCGVGYKQVALTAEATANALVNKALICSMNPYITKDEKRLRMYTWQNKLQEVRNGLEP